MKVIYRNLNWEKILITTTEDVAGLMSILEATKSVSIKGRDYTIHGYTLKYGGDEIPELYVNLEM
ncbi:TPA: hypothetical protein QCZ04_003495 [Bacillus cereus]|nr:hypothetical protein [Bacillus cereus]